MKKTRTAIKRHAGLTRMLFNLRWMLFGRGKSSYRCLTIRIEEKNTDAEGSWLCLNAIFRRK